MENWKEIEGFDGRYKINQYGDVVSLFNGEKKLKPIDNKGYLRIRLSKNDKIHSFYVARLVAEYFVSNPYGDKEVNHKDGNKQNNHVSNLEWCTRSQNMEHAFRTGLQKPRIGEKNNKAKLNKFQVQRIRLIKEITPEISLIKIARMFNVSYVQIKNILTRKHWKHIN